MTDSSAYTKTLENILATQDFSQLEPFKERSLWPHLNASEKTLLATLLTLQGKRQLKDGEKLVYHSFDLANELSPNNETLLIAQADILGSEIHNVYSLEKATDLIKQVIALNPTSFQGWRLWGDVLLNRGLLFQELEILQDANEKFQMASLYLDKQEQADIALFYREWALCCQMLGKQSGEAIDFRGAIEKYRKAADMGFEDHELYNDWGNALCELFALVNHPELLNEAIQHYTRTTTLSPTFFSGWLNLAFTLMTQFQEIDNQDLFDQAEHAFQEAAKLRDDVVVLWLKWGLMLIYAGKKTQQLEYVEASLEKFALADNCQNNHPLVLAAWAEALMILGTQAERLDLLREAESKIQKSIERLAHRAESWAIYGACLTELGRYFNDKNYYQQAIEKLQYGLSIDRSIPAFWYGLGLAHFAIGEMQLNISFLEKSCRFFSHCVNLNSTISPQAWNDWGVALMKLAEITHEPHYIHQAVEKFEQAIIRFNKEYNPDLIHPEWLYNYGCALDFLGDYEEDAQSYERAIQILTRVVHLDPDYSYARFNLALAYSHLGEINSDVDSFEKAVKIFEEVLVQDNEDEMCWNELGLTLMHLAQLTDDPSQEESVQKLYTLAESKLQHALTLGSIASLYNLACLFALTKNLDASMYYLERAERQGGLPKLDDLLNDEWLDNIRETAIFKAFLSLLTSKQPNEENG